MGAAPNSPNQKEDRDRNRYYRILEDELRQLDLTETEALALVDVTNGTTFTGADYNSLELAVSDACQFSDLENKWDIDGESLTRKVSDLSPGGSMAVLDAIERFWSLNRESNRSRGWLLEEVGLQ